MSHLQNHRFLDTQNLDQLREIMAHANSLDSVDTIRPNQEINAKIGCASIRDLNLFHAYYGETDLRVRCTGSDSADLTFCMLTQGHGIFRQNSQEYELSPNRGIVRDMSRSCYAEQHDFGSFAIALSRDTLKQHLRVLLGEDRMFNDLDFATSIDFTSSSGKYVQHVVNFVAQALDGPLRGDELPIQKTALRDMLLTTLLSSVQNSYSELLLDPNTPAVLPYYVKRARDYIHEYAHLNISLKCLCAHAGCGYRSLQIAFNKSFGMSPMTYLASVRLERIRADLLQADVSASVSRIARSWGMLHQSNFAQAYKKAYGVLPSETLRNKL